MTSTNGCHFDYEASLQAVSLREPQQSAATDDDDDERGPTLAEFIRAAHDGLDVPAWVARRVGKELCRLTGGDSVTVQVTAGLPAGNVSVSTTYNCSHWFDVD